MPDQQVERKDPRISVNKLGDYLVAPPAKRRKLIADQKRPKAFQTAYYGDAQSAIVQYLTAPEPDMDILAGAVKSINQATSSSDWEEQKLQSCADAIEAFSDVAEDLFEGLSVTARTGPISPEPLSIAGVAVSVRPEVLLRREKGDQVAVGALKLCFAKNDPLSADTAAYISWLVREHAETFPLSKARVDRKICLVLDVFAAQLFLAPATFTRRRRDIEAACEEIARAWPSA
jgi:hypothetical protein